MNSKSFKFRKIHLYIYICNTLLIDSIYIVFYNTLCILFENIFQTFQQEAAPAEGAPPGEGGAEGEAPPVQYTGSTMACHPWLSSMINYAQPVKFQSFETAESM